MTQQQTTRKCGKIEVIPGTRGSDGHPATPAFCGRCGIIIEDAVIGDVQRFRHGTLRVAADIRGR